MEASFKTSSTTSNDITVASAYYMNADMQLWSIPSA
jgi:hypothetical protein